MRYLRYAFLGTLTIILVSVALANRGEVTLVLLPSGLAEMLGFNWQMAIPMFVVIFGAIAAGLLIGFVWEWFREHKHRAEASRKTREAALLKREVSRLKDAPERKDDILALLDKAS